MVIIDLPIHLFVLLITSLLAGGIIIGIGLTSWWVKKELKKSTKKTKKTAYQNSIRKTYFRPYQFVTFAITSTILLENWKEK